MRLPVIMVAKQPCFLNRTCAESVSLASMACDACTAQDDVRDAGVEAEESDEALLDLVARGGDGRRRGRRGGPLQAGEPYAVRRAPQGGSRRAHEEEGAHWWDWLRQRGVSSGRCSWANP